MTEAPSVCCCSAVDDGERVVVPGSEVDACSGCTAPIYVAPSSRTIMAARPGSRLLCVACFVAYLDELKAAGVQPNILPRNEEQLAELETVGRQP